MYPYVSNEAMAEFVRRWPTAEGFLRHASLEGELGYFRCKREHLGLTFWEEKRWQELLVWESWDRGDYSVSLPVPAQDVQVAPVKYVEVVEVEEVL